MVGGPGALDKAACLENQRSWFRTRALALEKNNIVGSIRDGEVACLVSKLQGGNVESCWRMV